MKLWNLTNHPFSIVRGASSGLALKGDFIAGKATDPISLQRFTGLESLYAVGPLENARGEVSIYNSAALISEVRDGLVRVSIDLSRRAAFLVYTIVENWRRTTVRRGIAGEQ